MKKSIKRLPAKQQRQINFVLQLILEQLPDCCMVILYGSYARGNYVTLDITTETWGQERIFQSDYDICVLIPNFATGIAFRKLDKVYEKYEKIGAGSMIHTPLQIIVENIDDFNRKLEKGRYFYVDVVKEGIALFNDGKSKLSKPKKLNFSDIKQNALEHYDKSYNFGSGRLVAAKLFKERGDYVSGVFDLHQAFENYYKVILLVYTNYIPSLHKLVKLRGMAKRYSKDLFELFNLRVPFEKECFDLLCDAYINGRYDPTFKVTKEQFEYLLQKAEKFKELAAIVCQKQLAYYDELIEKEKNEL